MKTAGRAGCGIHDTRRAYAMWHQTEKPHQWQFKAQQDPPLGSHNPHSQNSPNSHYLQSWGGTAAF